MISTFTITVNLPAIVGTTGHFLPGVIGTAVTVISVVVAILQKYQADIAIITTAIEKADEAGIMTNDQKKQLASDLYFKVVVPNLTGKWIVLRLIPCTWVEGWISNIIDDICNKAKMLNIPVPQVPTIGGKPNA